ncbi:PAAR domain-containing protein [Pseudomonas sp. R5(2019)]|uniref:PAAR domain-containing protein n=1 Tax=Pseudomonas sp. R5(2019) TaxID=2697566 RepID=UPI001413481A|nr:PAAR domain-containing protein [Pseudomonas sp. R5(2019)]NBA96655.1 DUF2235 domain-containing protein [Pseudomonas sp. R5(2019)]
MATCYFVIQGDTTTTGGKVLSGSPLYIIENVPVAVLGTPVFCPACGLEGQIIEGNPYWIIDGQPAAHDGHEVACGCAPGSHRLVSSQRISSIEGATVRAAGHSSGEDRALSPPAVLRPGRTYRDSMQTEEYEEEEEEVEMEDEAVVAVTLRIGVFFDGTGNNATNSMLGAQCNSEMAVSADEAAVVCKPYMSDPDSSYGNDVTNIKKLSDLYYALDKVEEGGAQGFLSIYVGGIGTVAGEKDSLLGAAMGRGKTGVAGRVEHAIARVSTEVKTFKGKNPSCKISHLIFDIFGFSRGAAAARHFANEIALGGNGPLQAVLKNNKMAFTQSFEVDYQRDLEVGFIGLFDTVASVGGWTNFGYVRSPHAPGINLHLPRNRFPNVVHLVARDEVRVNFALNRVGPDHEELVFPGVHSDIGGGYHASAEERVLISPMLAESVSVDTPLEHTSIYKFALRAYDEYRAAGWPAEMLEIVTPASKLLPVDSQDRLGIRQKQVFVGLELRRQVQGELSRVYLRVMHALAKQKGVPFVDISEDPDLIIPDELRPYCERLVRGEYRMTSQEAHLLKLRYIHASAHWNPPTALQGSKPRTGLLLYVNAPSKNSKRVLHPHAPVGGYW